MKEHMKVITFALLMRVFFAGALAAQTDPEPPKFTIVISTKTPAVSLGSNIVIKIKTINISGELIPIEFGRHGNMPDGFHYDIRNEQGITVKKTVYNDIRPSRPPGATLSGELAPGKSKEDVAMISDVYSFNCPGKYTIRAWMPATRGTSEKPDLNRVYSNTITITVLPVDSNPSADKPPPAQQ